MLKQQALDESAEYYRDIYKQMYGHSKKYASGCIGRNTLDSFARESRSGDVVVDVGGGRSRWCERARHCALKRGRKNITFYSADIMADQALPEQHWYKPVQTIAWDLSPIEPKIDILVSFDMLEHLKEEHLDKTFEEWKSRAPRVMYMTIAFRPAIAGIPYGLQLHETVKPPEWWHALLVKHFGPSVAFVREKNYFKVDPQ